MRSHWLSLRVAVGFLTALPIPPLPDHAYARESAPWGRAFSWYPLVGLGIGALLAGAAWLLSWTALAPTVQAVLLLGLWIGVTGGLHLDGLMDSCDALFAPVSAQRRLQILRDVHAGTFGVLGLIWLLGLKWALLAQLIEASQVIPALLLAPLWGRWLLVWAAARFPYAHSEASLGGTMRQGLGRRQVYAASMTATVAQIAGALFDPTLLLVILAPLLVGGGLARWAAGRLGGGLTGDLYGALCEVTEGLVLLIVALR